MSKEEYVKLQAVVAALQKTVDNQETIDEILDLLSNATVAVDEAAKTEEEAIDASEETGNDEEGEPKPKQQFVILVSDTNKIITKDLVGWVLQIPENDDVATVVDSIKKGAYNFNASKKGQKYPVSSIGQAIANVPNKFFKTENLKIKTKEPVYVLTTNNVLPKS
jgi:translation elongation factor EF-G